MRPIGVPTGKIRSFRGASAAHFLILLAGASCASPPDEPVAEEAQANSTPCGPTQAAPHIEIGRSLAVTDLPTLEATDSHGNRRFSLERVLGQIAATSGDHGLDALGLYQRMFDTNNDKAHAIVADGQHCDDEKDANGNPVLNGFPLECPRQEGGLANPCKHNPFCSGPGCDPYTLVAATNRFDLADGHAQTCGQYRMVFAKGFQQSPLETAGNPLVFNRNLIILEAIMPNPQPWRGLAGCAGAVRFWADLSKENDPKKRAKALDQFYFSGIPGFPAAFEWDHFSGANDPVTGEQTGGQFRANQFMNTIPGTTPQDELQGQLWQLREYNLRRSCSGYGNHKNCKAQVRMVTTRFNPPASLFDEQNDQSPAAIRFRDPNNKAGFLSQVANLAQVGSNDINTINMNGLSREFNNGQSTSSPVFVGAPLQDTNYNIMFRPGPFADAIQARLNAIGSPLSPAEVVKRAQTQSCAGCHELATSTAVAFGGTADANQIGGGLVWPDAALGPEVAFPDAQGNIQKVRIAAFTQISDSVLLPLQSGVTCDTTCTAHPETCQCAWAVSPALSGSFLPFRKDNMIKFLQSLPQHGNGHGHDDDD